jgi:hypothetical protein
MKRTSLLILSIALLAGACTPQGPPSPTSLTAWIDAPLDHSTILLAPYQIVAHGSDPGQINLLEISIDGEILGVIENPDPDDLLLEAKVDWNPPAPGEYTIQARGQSSTGDWSNYARARVTVREEFQPLTDLELQPTETPALELISCEPEITATMNTTCRQGPTTYNEPITYLLEGESAPILGGNQDLSWWVVLPESQSDPCWVSGSTVEFTCLPDDPEILESPPYITRVFPSHEEFYWGDNPRRSVSIQAQCGGEIPLTGVRLIYHLAGKADWYNTTMASTEGEIWQAQIDAHTFDGYKTIESAVVEYYLEAINESGLTTKSPLFTNLLLKKVP